MTNRYLEKIAKEDYDYKNKSYTYHLSSNIGDDATIGAGVGAIGGAGIGGYLGNRAADVLSQSNKKVSKAALRGVGGAVGAVGGLLAGSVGGAIMGVPHGLYRGYSANSMKKEANCYLEKIAKVSEDISRDRYARQLGYEDPQLAAIKGGARNAALTSRGLNGRGEYGISDGIWTASNAAMGAAAANEEAHRQNALIRSIIEAQDHAIRTGKTEAFDMVKHDLDADPEGNRYAGYFLGGVGGAALGRAIGKSLGQRLFENGNLAATLAGAGIGALGLGYGFGKGLEYLAHAHNDSNAAILAAREAYVRARG